MLTFYHSLKQAGRREEAIKILKVEICWLEREGGRFMVGFQGVGPESSGVISIEIFKTKFVCSSHDKESMKLSLVLEL